MYNYANKKKEIFPLHLIAIMKLVIIVDRENIKHITGPMYSFVLFFIKLYENKI
jgi:hypothetical protein